MKLMREYRRLLSGEGISPECLCMAGRNCNVTLTTIHYSVLYHFSALVFVIHIAYSC